MLLIDIYRPSGLFILIEPTHMVLYTDFKYSHFLIKFSTFYVLMIQQCNRMDSYSNIGKLLRRSLSSHWNRLRV